MPITGTVEFQDNLTNVSISDEVFGGFCKDTQGKKIDKETGVLHNTLDFLAEPDVQTNVGTVIIKGSDSAGADYDELYNFSDGEIILFPSSKVPKTADVIKKFSNFQDFANLNKIR